MIPKDAVIVGVSRVPITACTWGRTKPSAIIARIASDEHERRADQQLGRLGDPEHVDRGQDRQPDQLTPAACGSRVPGNTLPRLAAPAARLTATVST